MRALPILLSILLLTASCGRQGLTKSAEELCKRIPNPECLEESKGYLTDDFYSAIEEMISLPDPTPVLHEWEFWFVAADGSAISSDTCKILEINKTDSTHAEALISVQPEDADYDAEDHILYLEKVNGKWLLADYDGRKADAIRYIARRSLVRNMTTQSIAKSSSVPARNAKVSIWSNI